ncbi:hypothetical protein PXW85_27100, partial [Klebsiella pneumoniae]|nr:hypothetical protein [Klebsiella pneumoniae]
LAYQILQAGYQLDIPLMFAALLLISLAGIALFGVMSWVSRRAACGHQPDRRGERRTLRQPVTAPSREQRHPAVQRGGPDA